MKILLHLVHLAVRLVRPAPARFDLHRASVGRGLFAALSPVPVSVRRTQGSRLPRDPA
jgi:hypothetical protein